MQRPDPAGPGDGMAGTGVPRPRRPHTTRRPPAGGGRSRASLASIGPFGDADSCSRPGGPEIAVSARSRRGRVRRRVGSRRIRTPGHAPAVVRIAEEDYPWARRCGIDINTFPKHSRLMCPESFRSDSLRSRRGRDRDNAAESVYIGVLHHGSGGAGLSEIAAPAWSVTGRGRPPEDRLPPDSVSIPHPADRVSEAISATPGTPCPKGGQDCYVILRNL
jgi:hypothetical protein